MTLLRRAEPVNVPEHFAPPLPGVLVRRRQLDVEGFLQPPPVGFHALVERAVRLARGRGRLRYFLNCLVSLAFEVG